MRLAHRMDLAHKAQDVVHHAGVRTAPISTSASLPSRPGVQISGVKILPIARETRLRGYRSDTGLDGLPTDPNHPFNRAR
jgi:hypothetical protein